MRLGSSKNKPIGNQIENQIRNQKENQNDENASIQQAHSRRPKILLVDPSTDQLDALQTVFPFRNYEIFHVVQINDAKEVLEKNKFAFVLIEIQKFARDAEHFARAVRETHYGQVGPILNTRIEVAAIRKDGAEIPMELTVIPIKTESGHYFYSNLRDLSDKKAPEAYRAIRS